MTASVSGIFKPPLTGFAMSGVFFTWCLFFQTNLYSILSIAVITSLQTKIKLHTYVINGRAFAFKIIIFPFIERFHCNHMLRRIFNLSMRSSKLILVISSVNLAIQIPRTFVGELIILILQIFPILWFLPNQIASVLLIFNLGYLLLRAVIIT